jgi:cell division protein FtsL
MSRKLRIIGVIILVLFIGIIVAAVYVIDVTKLFRPPIDTITKDRVETKLGMIFQTKIGGE